MKWDGVELGTMIWKINEWLRDGWMTDIWAGLVVLTETRDIGVESRASEKLNGVKLDLDLDLGVCMDEG